MRNIYCFFLILMLFVFTSAQVGINTTSSRGALDIQNKPSEQLGFIIPTVSSTEDLVITNGAPVPNGIMFYDASRDALCYKLENGFKCWNINNSTFIVPIDYDNASQSSYIKSSNSDEKDYFGYSVAISDDGNIMAVGTPEEDSNSQTINQGETNNQMAASGAVYVFERTSNGWVQQAYLKASNTGQDDRFGESISISSDGNLLVIGAPNEKSNAQGINQDPTNDSAANAGAVYVFSRSGNTWSQHSYIKASNTDSQDMFGQSVYISKDGSTLAVGAPQESSNAIGINQDQINNNATNAGAAYIFIFDGTSWQQQAYIKASNTGSDDKFGSAVALNASGNILAVGAPMEGSNSRGIDGDQTDNSSISGAVYAFERDAGQWMQKGYIKTSNSDTGDEFGFSLDLSPDGHTLAVSAIKEDSIGRGLNADPFNNGEKDSGAVYVFSYNGNLWTQQIYLKSSNSRRWTGFGFSLSLGTTRGDTLLVGTYREDGASTGINGDQNDLSEQNSGAAFIFNRNGSTWTQQAYVKSSNTSWFDEFGYDVAINRLGTTFAIGAIKEDSDSRGIDQDQSNDNRIKSGAVYVFEVP